MRREWLSVLCAELFGHQMGLFGKLCPDDPNSPVSNMSYKIDPKTDSQRLIFKVLFSFFYKTLTFMITLATLRLLVS